MCFRIRFYGAEFRQSLLHYQLGKVETLTQSVGGVPEPSNCPWLQSASKRYSHWLKPLKNHIFYIGWGQYPKEMSNSQIEVFFGICSGERYFFLLSHSRPICGLIYQSRWGFSILLLHECRDRVGCGRLYSDEWDHPVCTSERTPVMHIWPQEAHSVPLLFSPL